MLISAKTTPRTSIFFSPKEAQLLFRQLQKLSARNIAALKCESRKTKCWVPPLMQLSVNKAAYQNRRKLTFNIGEFTPVIILSISLIILRVSSSIRSCSFSTSRANLAAISSTFSEVMFSYENKVNT